MVEEVITRASDEDKEYFIKFRELVGVLEHYSRMQKMNKKATNGIIQFNVTYVSPPPRTEDPSAESREILGIEHKFHDKQFVGFFEIFLRETVHCAFK